jgi:hypothetical protein
MTNIACNIPRDDLTISGKAFKDKFLADRSPNVIRNQMLHNFFFPALEAHWSKQLQSNWVPLCCQPRCATFIPVLRQASYGTIEIFFAAARCGESVVHLSTQIRHVTRLRRHHCPLCWASLSCYAKAVSLRVTRLVLPAMTHLPPACEKVTHHLARNPICFMRVLLIQIVCSRLISRFGVVRRREIKRIITCSENCSDYLYRWSGMESQSN